MELHFIHGITVYFDFKPFRKRVRYRRAYAVKPARKLVVAVAELAARVQLRKYDLYARNAGLRVYIRGNTPAVIFYRSTAVFIEFYFYSVAIAVSRFVDSVIDYFPKYMVKPLDARRADIHPWAHTHRVKSF